MERLQFSVMDNIMSPDVTGPHRGSESRQIWRGVLLGLILVGWVIFPALPTQAVTTTTVPQLVPDKTTTLSNRAVNSGQTQATARPTAVGSSLQFSSPTYSLNEGAGTALITVTRTGDSSGPVTATVLITDVTTTAGSDYAYIGGGTLDTTFADPNLNDSIAHPVAIQSDGKVLVGGFFKQAGKNNTSYHQLARFNPDGSLDTSFPDPQITGVLILAVVVQPLDGKILVGGNFTSVKGIARKGLVRFNSDGSLDASFADPNVNSIVGAIALQPDGKIVIGGTFTTVAGQPRKGVARLNSDGSLDTSFADPNLNLHNVVYAIVVDTNGKVLVGGAFSAVGPSGQTHQYFVRLNSDGSIDDSLVDPGINERVAAVALQSDGKFLLGGYFSAVGGVSRKGMARFNTDGTLDTSFADPNLTGQISVVVIQPTDGKILTGYRSLLRFNIDGTPDTSFANPYINLLYFQSIALQKDNKIVVGGYFSYGASSSQTRNGIVRFNNDLTLSWADGDTAPKTISLPIIDDKLVEGDETLTLGLVNPQGGATTGSPVTTTLTIVDNDTTTNLYTTSQTNPSTFGQNVIFTATVSPLSAIGTVTFTEGANVLGTATLSNGIATYMTNTLSVGSHVISATYSGDSTFSPNSFNSVTQVVNRADTTASLTSAPNPTTFGQTVSFTATVSPSSASGTITLTEGTKLLGTFALSNGIATYMTNTLSVGSHVISVTYSGDATFNPSNSNTVTQVVNQASTTLSLAAGPNPTTFGQSVSFTATLAPIEATGLVTFTEGTTTLGTATLSNGVAIFTTSTLSVGSHVISATYGGDNSYAGSTSPTVTQSVIAGCNPLLVTAISDDGSGMTCGTFSAAVSQTVSSNTPITISFALTSGNIITFSGSLGFVVGTNVTIEGGPGGVILNGNGVSGDGLRLMGRDSLFNLTVEHFVGREIVIVGTGNRLRWVKVLP